MGRTRSRSRDRRRDEKERSPSRSRSRSRRRDDRKRDDSRDMGRKKGRSVSSSRSKSRSRSRDKKKKSRRARSSSSDSSRSRSRDKKKDKKEKKKEKKRKKKEKKLKKKEKKKRKASVSRSRSRKKSRSRSPRMDSRSRSPRKDSKMDSPTKDSPKKEELKAPVTKESLFGGKKSTPSLADKLGLSKDRGKISGMAAEFVQQRDERNAMQEQQRANFRGRGNDNRGGGARKPLTAEEKAARLAEMMNDGKRNEVEKTTKFEHIEEKEKAAEEMEARMLAESGQKNNAHYQKVQKEIYSGQGTMADRLATQRQRRQKMILDPLEKD